MPRKKLQIKTLVHIGLLLLAASLLLVVGTAPSSDTEPEAVKLTFRGEYSLDGSEWEPLVDDHIPSLGREISLHGRIDVPEDADKRLNLYFNHVACELELDGEKMLSASCCSDGDCGARWSAVELPEAGREYEVEITLRNEHGAGNTRPFKEFLDGLYLGSEDALKSELGDSYAMQRVLGVAIMVLSFGILGIALAFFVMHLPLGHKLWSMGLMSFCFGGFITLDTPDISLIGVTPEFCTCGIGLSIMLALLELGLLIIESMTGSRKKYTQILVYLEGVAILLSLALCLLGVSTLYTVFVIWVLVQIPFAAVVLVLCVRELMQSKCKNSLILLSCTVLLAVKLLELVNELTGWWNGRPVIKVVFSVMFLGYLVYGVMRVPERFRTASQAEKLETDLKNSRIVQAMSQIRSHFIFNILNAISGMCKYDPEKADYTVIRFARYLRSNIDVMQEDRMEPFETSLQHLEDYVALEQIRFGDRIRFTTDITVKDFELPPLVLQPIVENAIKHGLTPKAEGGTILLRTWEVRKTIFITIHDDGVGFDTAELEQRQSVGLSNVTFRIKQMLHGEIDFDSIPRRGTTVTIRIPRQEK